MRLKTIILILATLPLLNCAGFKFKEQKATIPLGQVKPEIDYSNETPDCTTAGQRIAENVQEGMALDDVIRLVGKPGWKLPGSWWWAQSFNNTGRPFIKFEFGTGDGDKPVLSFSGDTSDC